MITMRLESTAGDPVFLTVMVWRMMASGMALGLVVPFTKSETTVETLVIVSWALAALRVLVIVQATTSPSTGVIVPPTVLGKVVEEPAAALIHVIEALY
jgi:hypothetical protein